METLTETTRITKATFKSFIKKNRENLYVKKKSDFDGMTDCVEPVKSNFNPAQETIRNAENTLGIAGIWLVGDSRDYFDYFEDANFKGIEYFNSCGSGIIAIKKI